jgi:hypothetical protein
MLPQRERRQLLNEDEAAEFLKISVRSLQRRRVAGLPPKFIKLGARIVYDLDTLYAWVDENVRASTSEVRP